jgi:hypothetical protein
MQIRRLSWSGPMSPGVAMIMGILLYDTDASFVLVVLVQRKHHHVQRVYLHWFCKELLCVSH